MSSRGSELPDDETIDAWNMEVKETIQNIILFYCPRVTNPDVREYGLFCTNEAENPEVKKSFCLFSWYKMCLEIINYSKNKGLDPHVQITAAKT